MRRDGADLVVTLLDGTDVVVADSLEDITGYVLREQRDWFDDELGFLRRLVHPGMRALDVGANHGVYTLAFARLAGPGAGSGRSSRAAEPAGASSAASP